MLTHYSDVIMSKMSSQMTGVLSVCSAVCSGADQRKHQSAASLVFVRGIHRGAMNSPTRIRRHQFLNRCFASMFSYSNQFILKSYNFCHVDVSESKSRWIVLSWRQDMAMGKKSLNHWPLGDAAVIIKVSLLLRKNSKLSSLSWIPLNLTNDKWALFQAVAWCRQATSHFMNQCWPKSMSPYGVTKPRWYNHCPASWSCGDVGGSK